MGLLDFWNSHIPDPNVSPSLSLLPWEQVALMYLVVTVLRKPSEPEKHRVSYSISLQQTGAITRWERRAEQLSEQRWWLDICHYLHVEHVEQAQCEFVGTDCDHPRNTVSNSLWKLASVWKKKKKPCYLSQTWVPRSCEEHKRHTLITTTTTTHGCIIGVFIVRFHWKTGEKDIETICHD